MIVSALLGLALSNAGHGPTTMFLLTAGLNILVLLWMIWRSEDFRGDIRARLR
ncbi:MAG: hypothetical protein MO847_11005 [Candidatus Protistobacter heckmanni]|nr:hypothetical protein [Candidatus Protistobacter heckmanni]